MDPSTFNLYVRVRYRDIDINNVNSRGFFLGSIRGDRLLDFGTGPTIHTLISATQWFKEITLSEYAAPLRNELVKWRSGDKDAHDWRPFFKYVMDLEGSG